MDRNNKYKHYSAADIQKYLRGDLSAREMQALEAAALEDPFLADALEGMEKDRLLRDEDSFRTDMASLKDRLARRLAEKDKALVMPLYRSAWKVAAAVILLAGMGTIAYQYLSGRHSASPALASAAKEKSAPAADNFSASPTISEQRKDSGSGGTIAAASHSPNQPAAASEPLALASEPKAVSELKASSQPAVADPSKKITQPEKAKSEADSVTFKSTFAEADYAASEKSARAMPAPAAKRSFGDKDFRSSASGASRPSFDSVSQGGQFLVGKVTDNNNNRIPLITIGILGQQHIVRTDTNGLFRIQMLGSGTAKQISIGSTGFESVEVPAYVLSDQYQSNGGIANTIRLQPQTGAVGFSAMNNNYRLKKISSDNAANIANASATPQNNIVQQAVPAPGWSVYKSYLEKNKTTRSLDSTRKGTEAISFKVGRKGRLSSFKIESSLSPAHDSLLLHLIKHGPVWKPLNGNNSSATVILSY